MLNVDAGNRTHRRDNPRELRATWRVTWLAIAGLVLFVLLFIGFRVFRGQEPAVTDPQTPSSTPMQVPGERPPRSD